MKTKTPWINEYGKFELKSCKMVEAFILHETGYKVEAHKTSKYLVFNYVKNASLYTTKIELPAGALYCLEEHHFSSLIQDLWIGSQNG